MTETILAVDDERHIQRLIQVNLERCGYRVLTASDGPEALEMIAAEQPDLVVLDWMMPRLNGLETMKRLKATPATAELPIIMLTAKAGDEDVLKGWNSGADCYLTKPFNPMELLRWVKAILARKDEADDPDRILLE